MTKLRTCVCYQESSIYAKGWQIICLNMQILKMIFILHVSRNDIKYKCFFKMIFILIVHSFFGKFNSPTHSTSILQYCILYLECDRTEIGLLRVIVVKIQEHFPVDKNFTHMRISLVVKCDLYFNFDLLI